MNHELKLHDFLKTNNVPSVNNSIYNTIKKNSENIEKNFLNILIEQIKNQDPIHPITNSELTSQLAQIKTAVNVEKIENFLETILNQIDIKNIIKHYSSIKNNNMFSNSSFMYKNTDNNIPLKFTIHNKATSVNALITDQQGKLIFLKNLGTLNPGTHQFQWNGKDIFGNNVPTARYQFSIIAKKENQLIQADLLTI
ncbi:hypothetical protein HIC20_01600 [Buchnera aphidicola (Hormaphis cornu)]|nr:hypothetical protein HIC20_01600 [Buchnera aphidicola (Hormaphis cornu)]